MVESEEERHFRDTVDLKDPALAGCLAWLIPGLGHLYQGRYGKAGLFFVCIFGTFFWGLYLGSDTAHGDGDRKSVGWARVVYASWREGDKRLPYLCQIGAGLPALPALVQAIRASHGKQVWWNGFMAPPPILGRDDPREFDEFGQPTADTIQKRLCPYFDLGTAYTMIAGLLNILAIYDACCGPVFAGTGNKDEKRDAPKRQKQKPATDAAKESSSA